MATVGAQVAIRDVPRGDVPALVFVSRNPPTNPGRDPISGVGPLGRTRAVGGRLIVREKNGRLRTLVPRSALYDVSDPCVSWDARRVVFAGLVHPDSAWRLYVVGADGRGLAPVTRTDRTLDLSSLGKGAKVRFARYDDFDPAWLPDGRIVFASTRFPQVAQQGGLPVSNLFVVRADGKGLERITTERNGAEEPTIDPATGRVVYARWFFNPYLSSDVDVGGLTVERGRAVPADTVDFWQAVSIFPDGDRIELAAGDLRARGRTAAYQPSVLPDGRVVAVSAPKGSMLPAPAGLSLTLFAKEFGEAKMLVDASAIGAGSRVRGAVVSPAALGKKGVAFAMRQGSGTFGIYRLEVRRAGARPGPPSGQIQRIVDLEGTDELDPCALVRRKVPPVLGAQGGVDDPAWTLPVERLDQVRRGDDTFRFDCLNVYLTGPVDSPFPDAPRIAKGARIRFYATLARPGAALGDTVVLVREARLEASGAVHESDIPGDVPMFEQLVDEAGRVLRSAHGPAHVPGSNFARTGSGTKCVGCHEGHSALPVPKNNLEAKWFNASPSATVTVSSRSLGGGRGGAALVDRRAKGPIRETGWVAEAAEGQSARLAWGTPIEARAVVLYAPSADVAAGTRLQVRGCDVIFFRDGREVGRASAGRVRPEGTRIEFPPVRLDALEVRPTGVRGLVERRPVVALAEIETIARLIE